MAAGYSYHSWKLEQEQVYTRRLQFLIDRKDRRDKWDSIYFNQGAQLATDPSDNQDQEH
jgi:hypothetical protein